MPKGQTVLIAGGTGLIGSALSSELESRGHKVYLLSRQPGAAANESRGDWFHWSPGSGTLDLGVLSSNIGSRIDVIVNLAGSSISKMPWTKSRRADILNSRIAATHEIVAAIAALPAGKRPEALVNGSAVGFYGSRGDEKLTEASTAGTGFLAEVTQAWEAEASLGLPTNVRLVLARTGLVLASSGALSPIRLLTKMFAAGPLAGGKAWWPWISLRDEVRALAFLIENHKIVGPVNLVGPTPATSSSVMRAVATLLRRPYWLPAPRFAISASLGQAGRELLLSSQKVSPTTLLSEGFEFQDSTAESALSAILQAR